MENILYKAGSNVKKLYIYSIFEMMLFATPILVPFYISIGLKESDIFLAQATFTFAIAAFEVPSGYIADYFGRKKTMVASGLMAAVGIFFYTQAASLTHILLAEIVLGIAVSLHSGVKEAIMFDSLLLLRQEAAFHARGGLLGAFGLFSEGAANIIGGALAMISLKFPLYGELMAFLFAALIATTLHEPERKLLEKGKHMQNFKKAFHELWWKNRKIFWLTMVSAVISASTFASLWFSQIFLKRTDLSLVWFGIWYALGSFAGAYGNYVSHRMRKYVSESGQWALIILLALIGFIAMYLGEGLIWVVGFTLAPRLAWGLLTPLSNDRMNHGV
jgi:MFS family permease